MCNLSFKIFSNLEVIRNRIEKNIEKVPVE